MSECSILQDGGYTLRGGPLDALIAYAASTTSAGRRPYILPHTPLLSRYTLCPYTEWSTQCLHRVLYLYLMLTPLSVCVCVCVCVCSHQSSSSLRPFCSPTTPLSLQSSSSPSSSLGKLATNFLSHYVVTYIGQYCENICE